MAYDEHKFRSDLADAFLKLLSDKLDAMGIQGHARIAAGLGLLRGQFGTDVVKQAVGVGELDSKCLEEPELTKVKADLIRELRRKFGWISEI